jgi:hypothetical protein
LTNLFVKNIKLNFGGWVGALGCGVVAAAIVFSNIKALGGASKIVLLAIVGGAFAGNYLWGLVYANQDDLKAQSTRAQWSREANSNTLSNGKTSFRMPIVDVFDIQSRNGPVVTGRVESGVVRVGDRVVVESVDGNSYVIVVAIEKFQQPGLTEASAGNDDVGLELSGVSVQQARRATIVRSE